MPFLLALALLLGASLPDSLTAQSEGDRVALVVAVGEYGEAPKNPNTGEDLKSYSDLNAGNDVPLITGALKIHGFRDEDIRVVQDEEATAEGIREAFRWLERQVDDGDVVVFHYSGHGHRITNDNPDQDEEVDGYDELLVPHGAPETFYEGYAGDLHIRDDELGDLLQRLRQRAGPTGNVTFLIDACFSGTATRSGEEPSPDQPLVRGVETPIGEPAMGSGSGTRGGNEDMGTGLEASSSVSTRSGGDGGRLAPFAVFSAASQRQVAYETYDVDGSTRVGSLSYAMARVLPSAKPGDTYRTLMERVTNTLAGRVRQTPQAEGTLDAQLFSSRLSPQRPYVTVDSLMNDGALATLGAGTLLGLNPGARLEVYPTGSGGPGITEPMATLEVIQSSPVQSIARPWAETGEAAKLDQSVLNQWAFVVERDFGDLATRVRLDPGLSERDLAGATARLSEMGIVQLVDDRADVEVYSDDGIITALATADSLILARGAARVIQQVEFFARAQYLRRLSFEAPRLDVVLELVPTEVTRDMLGRITGCVDPDWDNATSHPAYRGAGQWELRDGDIYHLRVRNVGERRAFVALLDILPRGDVQVLRPRDDESPQSYELEAGRDLPLGCYQLEHSQGVETLKVFATMEPQDFRATFATVRNRNAAADLGELAEVLADSRRTRSSLQPRARGVATTHAIHIRLYPAEPEGN